MSVLRSGAGHRLAAVRPSRTAHEPDKPNPIIEAAFSDVPYVLDSIWR
jgi:hypothetical protein